MSAPVLLWRFAAACVGSVMLALILAAVLPAALRRWPALAAHRSTWLLAQGAVALVVVLACLPLPRSGALPAIAVAVATAPVRASVAVAAWSDMAPAIAPLPAAAAPDGIRTDAARPAAAMKLRRLLAWLPAAWLLVYAAGLAWHTARRLQASRRWHRHLLHHSRQVTQAELADWPGICASQHERIAAAGLGVRTTALPVSPVLLGGRRRCLVLPAHLQSLDMSQQRLIVEHELTHWRRADPRWLLVAAIGALLFWFNRPFMRLVDGLRDAVELGCDDAVLAGRSPRERHGYASALVAQLKFAHLHAYTAPAFGESGVTQRVLRMRQTTPARLSLRGRLACAAAALGLAGIGAALQPAFSAPAAIGLAGVVPAAIMLAPPTAAAHTVSADEAWIYPIAAPRVTSLYGVRSDMVPVGHHGVDFAARRGTPVLAPARGTVVEAAMNPVWGNYVRIDHGAGRSSLAMHLDHATVAYGQHVAAGDVIGAAGSSGRATGPHLHLEYWQDGRRLNPELMLADLPAHATARALARRRAQGNPVPTDE